MLLSAGAALAACLTSSLLPCNLHVCIAVVCVRQTTNVVLLFFTAGAVALGFYTQETTPGGVWVSLAMASTSALLFFMCLLGLIGALRLSSQMLRLVGVGC